MSEFTERLDIALNGLKVSNYQIAKDLKMSRTTISNYRKGLTSPNSPTTDAIINYLSHKGISKNWLLLGEGEMLSTKREGGVEEEKGQYDIITKNGMKFRQLPNGTYVGKVPVIPFTAYASYVESLETGTVEKDFDSEVFKVDKVGMGNYKAFIVRGDSMNGGGIDDTKDGATVLGRELQRHHWMDGFRSSMYGWIILSKQNIFHKDIIDFDYDTGDITCHSRNPSPEFGDFKINLNDVYQIFKVIKRTF